MPLDCIASEAQFADHLAPIWHALPASERGVFEVPTNLHKHAASLGIEAVTATSRTGNPVLVASWGDTQRAFANNRPVARTEHGIGQSYAGVPGAREATHPSYAGGRNGARIGLFLVPNEHSAQRWQAAYPNAKVSIVGCPKLDAQPPYEPEGPTVCVSTHWNARDVAPETWSAFEDYQSAIVALSRSHRVIGHSHPRDASLVRRWFVQQRLEFVETFREVVRRAALYVTDNSSTLYEFAATGRPVVVLNRPTLRDRQGRITQCGYRRNVRHGLRFWEAADVGVQVDEPAGLAAAVDLALADPPQQQANREAALRIVYAYRSGAAERAAAALTAWMERLPEMQGAAIAADPRAAQRAAVLRGAA